MYLRSLHIDGLRPIRRMRLDFGQAGRPGWHVVIGANGTGKSTIIRALALAMLSESDIDASRAPVHAWLRSNGQSGRIGVRVLLSKIDFPPGWSKVVRSHQVALDWTTIFSPGRSTAAKLLDPEHLKFEELTPWHRATGCFSATFGTFRRLASSDTDRESLFEARPRLGCHLSALDDNSALIEAERWLQAMHVEELEAERDLTKAIQFAAPEILRLLYEGSQPSGREGSRASKKRALNLVDVVLGYLRDMEETINRRLRLGAVAIQRQTSSEPDVKWAAESAWLDAEIKVDTLSRRILRFLNRSGFLFEGLKIVEIRKDQIVVKDGDGPQLDLRQMSDGYRSVLGLGFEILRLMLNTYGLDVFQRSLDDEKGVIDLPGIVAIDEIEAHLHPPWQEKIGEWLQRCFPRVQFIVTTHSPIVCRPIVHDGEVRGSAWLLNANSEADIVVSRIVGTKLDRLVFGDILEAVGTQAFGRRMEQSDAAEDKVDRLSVLNGKEVRGLLLDDEFKELEHLRRIFPSSPAFIDP